MGDIALDSTVLKSASYQRGALELAFESGHHYRYFGVPRALFDALLAAPSKGRYFHDHIRGYFPYRRLD